MYIHWLFKLYKTVFPYINFTFILSDITSTVWVMANIYSEKERFIQEDFNTIHVCRFWCSIYITTFITSCAYLSIRFQQHNISVLMHFTLTRHYRHSLHHFPSPEAVGHWMYHYSSLERTILDEAITRHQIYLKASCI